MGELEQRRSELFSRISATLSAKPGVAGKPSLFSGRFAELPYWLLLIPIVVLAAWVRTRNLGLLVGKYLIELDSYLWYRYAKIIFDTGALPAIDTARYVPVGVDTSQYAFFSYTLAYFYKFIHMFFPSLQQITWHVYYPVVVTVLSLPFFFLFVRKITNVRVAVVATAFLTVIPAYIQRTSAGFADHEAMAMLWMFIALMFFAYMWTEKDWKKSISFGALGGLFAGFMAGTWGGFAYLAATLGIFLATMLLFSKISAPQYKGYITFYIILAVTYAITKYTPIISFLKSQDGLYMLFPIIVVGAYWLTKLPKLDSFLQKIDAVLPRQALVTALLFAIGIVIGQLLGIIDLHSIYQSLTRANPNRWTTTVAENASPFFFGGGGWWDSFGWALLFALAGGVLLSIYIFKNREFGVFDLKRQMYAYIAGAIYVLFFSGFIFGRYNSGGRFQTIINFFSKYYISWLLMSLAAFVLLYLCMYYKDRVAFVNTFTEDKWVMVLLFVFFSFSLVGSRILIRLMFGLSPAVALVAAWFMLRAIEKTSSHNKTKIIAIILVLFMLLSFYSLARTSYNINRTMGSMVPGQWEAAMNFLNSSTPEDSVVTHWWDYGHMTTAVGARRAVTDGGNLMSWNHASGRYFLTGKDSQSTLEYLYSHQVNYTLISNQEISKYYAFSLIGSDDSLDRLSTIGMFGLQDKREARDGDLVLYGGQWTFDSDITTGDVVLPRGGAQIQGFSLLVKNNGVAEVKAYISNNGNRLIFDVGCLYIHTYRAGSNAYIYGNRRSFPQTENTLPGCLVIVPFIDNSAVNDQGAAFWLSGKVWATNFARLYMYGEDDKNFQQVYSDALPLGFYNGQPIGPIKIWKVQYPEGVKTDPKYLEPSPYG